MTNHNTIMDDARDYANAIYNRIRTGEKPIITSPESCYDLLRIDMQVLDQEELRVVCLSNRNHVEHIETIYKGNANSSMVRISEVFRPAIVRNTPAIIIAHNHPSGNPSPSPHDIDLTREIIKAGRLLDIQVLDHLIIGRDDFVSLNAKGLGFGQV